MKKMWYLQVFYEMMCLSMFFFMWTHGLKAWQMLIHGQRIFLFFRNFMKYQHLRKTYVTKWLFGRWKPNIESPESTNQRANAPHGGNHNAVFSQVPINSIKPQIEPRWSSDVWSNLALQAVVETFSSNRSTDLSGLQLIHEKQNRISLKSRQQNHLMSYHILYSSVGSWWFRPSS